MTCLLGAISLADYDNNIIFRNGQPMEIQSKIGVKVELQGDNSDFEVVNTLDESKGSPLKVKRTVDGLRTLEIGRVSVSNLVEDLIKNSIGDSDFVKLAGDTMTGDLNAPNIRVSNDLTVSNNMSVSHSLTTKELTAEEAGATKLTANEAIITNLHVVCNIEHGNSHAVSPSSFASGYETYANSRGWYFKAIDQNNKIIYLTESKITNANQIVNVKAGQTAAFYNSMNSKECVEVNTPEEQDFNKTLSKIWVETNIVVSAEYFPSWVSLVLEYHDDFSIVATSAVPGKIYYTGNLKELNRQFTASMVNSQDALNPDYGVVKFLIERSSTGASLVPTSANVAGYLNNKGAVTTIKSYDANLTDGPALVSIYSAVFGRNNFSLGNYDFVSGQFNVAYGDYSSVSGKRNAVGYMAHGEGMYNRGFGMYSHVEGYGNIAWGYESHAEGKNTVATGDNSHSAGYKTWALGKNSHSEGMNAVAKDLNSYTWSGNDGTSTEKTTNTWYHSHGSGTFNINPKNGLGGFYIGETPFNSILNQYAHSADLETLRSNLGERITAHGESISKIENEMVNVSNGMSGFSNRIDTAESKIETIENDVAGILEEMPEIHSGMDDFTNKISTVSTELADVKGTVATLTTNLNEVVDDVRDAKSDITTLYTDVSKKVSNALFTNTIEDITNNVIPKKSVSLTSDDAGYLTFSDLYKAISEGFEVVEGGITNKYKILLKKVEQ